MSKHKKLSGPPPGVPASKPLAPLPKLELPSEWDVDVDGDSDPIMTGAPTLPASVELAETHQELAKLQGELEVAKAQVTALQREKVSLAEAFDGVHNELIAVRAQLASAKADVAAPSDEVPALRAKIEELTRQLRRHHGFKT